MERVFRRGSHQYERFDCFKLSGRMTVDDFGGDLMRGTIAGGGAAGRWLSFEHRPPKLFSSPVLYFSEPYCNSHKKGYLCSISSYVNQRRTHVFFLLHLSFLF